MNIDIGKIAGEMLGAALPKLTSGGEKAKDFAEAEMTKIAKRIAEIGEKFAEGKLSEADAKALLEMQVESTKIVLLTVEGLTIITIEAAINAAMDVVKRTVNTALGFGLI